MTHDDARTLYIADPPRKCGSCTLCCTLLPVQDLGKPRNTRCDYLRHGKGCTIYADRPTSCRMFNCRWLMQPELLPGGWLRPDHSHVVFDPSPDYIVMTDNDGAKRVVDVQQIWVDPRFPTAFRDARVRAVIERIAQRNGIPTLARIGFGAICIFAPCLCPDGQWHEERGLLDQNRLPEDQTLALERWQYEAIEEEA